VPKKSADIRTVIRDPLLVPQQLLDSDGVFNEKGRSIVLDATPRRPFTAVVE
jgi:hypothetical protein